MAEATYRRTGDGGTSGGPDPLEGQYGTIGSLLYATAGIALGESKRELVHSRLMRRFRQIGWGSSVAEYVTFIQKDEGRAELTEMVDLLTTNKTHFFREASHFDFLSEELVALGPDRPPLRLWSAGCSSGEEAYTLAMVLMEAGYGSTARILATDLSRRMLERAVEGSYSEEQIEGIPAPFRGKYLVRDQDSGKWKVAEKLRNMVRFGRLNLMGPWPMRGSMDVIFCRNVMIYFDQRTRATLVSRFHELLAPKGLLFVGHSESLSALDHRLTYIQPATYRR